MRVRHTCPLPIASYFATLLWPDAVELCSCCFALCGHGLKLFFHILGTGFICWCRQTAHMRIAAALLESYERQVQSVEGALKVVTL